MGFEDMKSLNDVRQRCASLERTVRWRDYLEIAVVPFVLIFIGVQPKFRQNWLAVTSAVMMGIWAISIVVILLRAQRQKPVAPDASAADFVRQKLQWCDGQIRLLKNVAAWYVSPCIVACTLFVWADTQPFEWMIASGLTLFFIAFGVFLVWMNRRAANSDLVPFRNELARVLDDL